jgi:hypothetical protein
MTQASAGNRTYELIRDFLKLPNRERFGQVSRVATDSQDRVHRWWSSTARVLT